MEYEKKYNDLIARINAVKNTPKIGMKGKHHYDGYVETGIRDALDYIINPESEDERIRKQIEQEQPEADLDKEVKSYIKDNFTITDEIAQIPEEDRRYSMWEDDMVAFAKHFYKLGRTRKEK